MDKQTNKIKTQKGSKTLNSSDLVKVNHGYNHPQF
jgi:hypothetical protein